MKSNFKRLLSLLLSALFAFQIWICAAPTAMAEGDDTGEEIVTEELGDEELEEYLHRFVIIESNDDGTSTATFSFAPIRYQDDDGSWQDIDNTLAPNTDTAERSLGLLYTNSSAEVDVDLAASSANGVLASAEYDGKSISFSPATNIDADMSVTASAGITVSDGLTEGSNAALFVYTPDEAEIQDAEEAQSFVAGREYAALRYEDVFASGTDIVLEPVSSGIKESIILDSFRSGSYSYVLSASGMYAQLSDDGNVIFYDEDTDELAGFIAAPYMEDSAVEIAESYDIDVDLTELADGSYLYELTPDTQWLASEDRVYPVTIDPSFTFNTESYLSDTFVAEKYPDNCYVSDTHIKVGNSSTFDISRGLFRIKSFASALGSDKTILSATFKAYQDYTGSSAPSIGLYGVSSTYAYNTVTWNTAPTCGTLAAQTTVDDTGWFSWDVTSRIKNWYNTAPTVTAFYMKNVSESANMYKRFRSINYSSETTYAPKLTVVYLTKPTNVKVSPTTWTNGSVTVTHSTQQASGNTISYQYAVSTSNTTPPTSFTDFGNKTEASHTMSFATGSKYVWVRAKASSGAVSEAACSSAPYKVDKNAPSVSNVELTSELENGRYTVSWSGVTERYSGMKSVEVKVGDADYVTVATGESSVSGSYTFTTQASGFPTVTLRLTDNADNSRTKSASVGIPTIQAAPMAGGAVKIGWTPVDSEGASYTLYRMNSEGTFEAIASGLTQAGYIDRGLVPAQSYTYKVRTTYGDTTVYSGAASALATDPADEAAAIGARDHGELVGVDVSDGSVSVHALTGNMEFAKTDVTANTAGSGLSLTRTYNSLSAADGVFGSGWGHSFESFLAKSYTDGVETAIYWADGSGMYYRFAKSGSSYTSPAGLHAALTSSDSGYTLTLKGGTVYAFDAEGTLMSVTDKLGKATQYIYNDNGELAAVKNEYGCFIALEYDGFSRIVSAAAGSDYASFIADESYECYGLYQYAYDTTGRLVSVTRPDSGTEQYAYENGRLSSFTDAQAYEDIQAAESESSGDEASEEDTNRQPINEFSYDSAGRLDHAVDAGNGKTVFTYADASATVKTYEDMSNENVYSTDVYSFDSSGRLASVSNNGRTTSYAYNNNGEVTSVTEPDNHSYSYVYDSNGNITSYTDRAGNQTAYSYETGMNSPKTVTESRGALADRVTHYTYNAYEQMTSAYTEGTATKTFTTYITQQGANFGKVEKEISVTGDVTADTQFSEGLLTNVEYYVTCTTYTYDAMGNVLSSANGTLTSSNTYNSDGLTASSTEGGVTTAYTYDAMGNVTATATGSKNQSTAYNKLGSAIFSEDAMGYETETLYNAMGEVKKEEDPLNTVSKTEYGIGKLNDVDRRYMLQKTMQSQSTSLSEYLTVYDEHGDVILEGDVWLSNNINTEGSSDGINTVSAPMSFEIGTQTKYLLTHTYTNYDSMGRVLSTSNEAGDSTSYVYDVNGNVTRETVITGNTGSVTENSYDAAGRLTSTRTSKYARPNKDSYMSLVSAGPITSYTYDILDRVITEELKESDAEGAQSITTNSFIYDQVEGGLLMNSTIDAKDRITQRLTNSRGELVKERFLTPNANGNYVEKYRVDYGYFTDGNLHTATRIAAGGSVTTTYSYDSYGRQSTIDYGTHKVSYTYDNNDNVLTASRLSDEDVVENVIYYTYDANGNITKVTRNGEDITYSYDKNGNRTNMSYGGVSAYTHYDGAGKITENGAYVTSSPSGKSIYRKHYFINEDLTTILEYRNSSDYIFRSFTYDDEGKVISKFDGNRSYGWDEKQFITYDDEGRIISEQNEGYYSDTNAQTYSTQKTHTYDWLGRLATETVDGVTTTYTYDEVGNLISKTTGGVTTTYTINEFDQVEKVEEGIVTLATYTYDISGNRISKYSYGLTTTYAYDGQNNLTSVTGTQYNTSTYTYDANGERLTKQNQSHTTQYYYDGVDLLFTKRDGAIDVRYLYDEGTLYGAVYSDGIPYWYNTDIRGSVTNILKGDATSSITTTLNKSYVYDAYGNTDVTSTTEFRNAVAYTGAIYDEETGLYYLMSRYYDPTIAQFISEDSYRGDGEHFWNLYMYCEGDPVNRTDRTGQWGKNITYYVSQSSYQLMWGAPGANKAKCTIAVRFRYLGTTLIRASKTNQKTKVWKVDNVQAVINGGSNWTTNGIDLDVLRISKIVVSGKQYYSLKKMNWTHNNFERVEAKQIFPNQTIFGDSFKCTFYGNSVAGGGANVIFPYASYTQSIIIK